jgi:hypothetical protein
MRLWFSSAAAHAARRPVRLALEPLEDRCLPAATMLQPGMLATPQQAAGALSAGESRIAALSHDQIHNLQDQSQQQASNAAFTLAVEQFVLGFLQPFAPQVPQFKPLITTLTGIIPAQQTQVQTLQNQLNLLNQLDDLQDQVLILGGVIQNDTALVPVLQRFGAGQTASSLLSTLAQDQAAVLALQPQIAAVEQQVSTFVP